MNNNPHKFTVNKVVKAYTSGTGSHFSAHELLPGQTYTATSIGESHLVVAGLAEGDEEMYLPINSTQCWSRVKFLPQQPDTKTQSQ